MSTRQLLTAIVACALAGGAAPCAAQVINGSFENGTFTPDGNDLMSLQPGSTAIAGWTTFGGELVWAHNLNPFVAHAADGQFWLDLTGYHDASPYGGVTQTVATVPGTDYRLSYVLGVNQDDGRFSGPVSVAAVAGSASTTSTYNPAAPGVQWGTFNLDFTANAATTTLSFQGMSGAQYIGLDNIQLNPVPEPSALVLAGAGMLGAAVRARRKGTRGAVDGGWAGGECSRLGADELAAT
jgi:hypothetical protein